MKKRKVNISIGTDFYKTLQRTDIPLEGAFREMIDNSTTSFMDHKEELKDIGEDKCKVTIEWDDDEMVIQDNAYGMNFDDFSRAFGLNKRAKHYSKYSRGQYGLGLKYGAISIGSEYTVETIELNSGQKFKGVLDVDYLEEYQPEDIDSEITDVPKHYHGTKITIKRLTEYKYSSYIKPKSKTLDNLKKKLSLIYSDDLRNNRLELWLNKEQIFYEDPVWQTDSDGNYVYKNFSNSFTHNGIEYKYSGWLGQLETADVAGAGFSLLQKNRAVEINYRPKEIFSQSNSFPYQRIVGEINLSGDNWIVSFTKSKVKWAEGVEEMFINSLLELREIKEIKTYVNKFRKNNKTITVEELAKKQKEEDKNTKKSTANNNNKIIEKIDETLNNKKTKDSKKDSKPFFVLPDPGKDEQQESGSIVFEHIYKGIKYTFDVISETSSNKSFYKLKKKNSKNNEYILYVDTFYGIFSSNSKNANEKYFNFKIATYLALSQIIAETKGVKKSESQIIIDIFNELINK